MVFSSYLPFILASLSALGMIIATTHARPTENERVKLWHEAGNTWPPNWQDESPKRREFLVSKQHYNIGCVSRELYTLLLSFRISGIKIYKPYQEALRGGRIICRYLSIILAYQMYLLF